MFPPERLLREMKNPLRSVRRDGSPRSFEAAAFRRLVPENTRYLWSGHPKGEIPQAVRVLVIGEFSMGVWNWWNTRNSANPRESFVAFSYLDIPVVFPENPIFRNTQETFLYLLANRDVFQAQVFDRVMGLLGTPTSSLPYPLIRILSPDEDPEHQECYAGEFLRNRVAAVMDRGDTRSLRNTFRLLSETAW